jgi:CBS domain-containing protein/ribosome-associated translation inhibitor RaiA
MDSNYASLEIEDTLSKAFPLFEQTDLIVVAENDEYYGVLVKKDVMKAKIPHDAKVKTFIRHAPTITRKESSEEIARLMFESGIYQLPVVENNKLIEVVRSEQLLKNIVETKFGDTPIKHYMTTPVITIAPDDTVGKAIKVFKQEDISHLPVMENEKILGIIIMDDVITKIMHPEDKPTGRAGYGEYIAEKKEYLKLPVKGIMKKATNIMSPKAKTKDVIKRMLRFKLRGLLLGTNRQLQGIVTKRDLLEPLVSYGCREPLFIQFAGELDTIKGFNKGEAINDLQDTFKKYTDFLDHAQVFVHLKQHDETRRGLHLIYCKMRLYLPGEMFIASDQGWGFMQAIRNAAVVIEKQIRRDKRR